MLILIIASFLRFYRLSELMIFGGDVARDYCVARDITLLKKLPLLGSPSSVPWLHQGPFFTYFLGLILWLGKYNPLVGGYFVGGLGVFSVLAVYFLGKKFFSEKAGLWAALFYSTSPLVVIFDRYPYHQSLTSLFTILFFLSLFYSLKKNFSFLFLSSFIFGLLLQIELSNLVLFPILLWIFWDLRSKSDFKILTYSVFAFFISWLPKIIYDLSSGFTQTLGFAAWIIHKLIPFGPLADRVGTTISLVERIRLILDFFSKMIFWNSLWFSAFFLLLLISFLIFCFRSRERIKTQAEYLVFLWLFLPAVCFLIQGSPALSYMPVFFALPALLYGYFLERVKQKFIFYFFSLLGLTMVLFNSLFLLKNDYLMLTGAESSVKVKFNMGQSFRIQKQMAEFLVNDSKKKPFNLVALGAHGFYPSSTLDLVYLTWYLGGKPSPDKEKIKYYVFLKEEPFVRQLTAQGEKVKIKKTWTLKEFPYMIIAKEEKND